MADVIERPIFYEGQILAPDDLGGSLEYGRDQLARHERYLHLWGIATGLELVTESRTTPTGESFKAVTVNPGVAIDPSGREIVVPTAQPLGEGLFDLINGDRVVADAWYPVFLVGQDETAPPPAGVGSACDVLASSRVSELFEITFGRLGEEADLDEQAAPGVASGPGGAPGDTQARILLGFVQWDDSIQKFKDAQPKPEAVGPRYAGVSADAVVARGGALTLRSRPPAASGKPAVVVDDANGGSFAFGLQDARGKVTPVFTVNGKGDVWAGGNMKSEVASGVQIESGIATDGLLLPLPKGITADQVDAGQVVLHVHASPRYDNLGGVGVRPVVCTVEGRRLHCVFRRAGNLVPGRADYTVLAFVPAGGGS
jgi:hypothetical protein